MSQIYPHVQRPDSAEGGPAPMQTIRTSYITTAQDAANGFARVPVSFPYAYPDTNYTIVMTVESESGISSFALSRLLSPSGFQAQIGNVLLQNITYVVHVLVIHD